MIRLVILSIALNAALLEPAWNTLRDRIFYKPYCTTISKEVDKVLGVKLPLVRGITK